MDDLLQQLEIRIRKLIDERSHFEHKQAELRRKNETMQMQHAEAISKIEILLAQFKSLQGAQS